MQGAQAVVHDPDGRLRMVFRDQYGQEQHEVEASEAHKTIGKSRRHAVPGGVEAWAHSDMECVGGCLHGSLQACMRTGIGAWRLGGLNLWIHGGVDAKRPRHGTTGFGCCTLMEVPAKISRAAHGGCENAEVEGRKDATQLYGCVS